MRVRVLALAVLSILVLCVPPAANAQQAPCQFILGFQTLRDLDPNDIGNCVDNQAFAANGDAQQHTSKGLMAWRKADNWTAFTNGYRTWVNGPSRLVSRLNSERFPWEHDQPGPSTMPSIQVLSSGRQTPGTPSCCWDWDVVTISGYTPNAVVYLYRSGPSHAAPSDNAMLVDPGRAGPPGERIYFDDLGAYGPAKVLLYLPETVCFHDDSAWPSVSPAGHRACYTPAP